MNLLPSSYLSTVPPHHINNPLFPMPQRVLRLLCGLVLVSFGLAACTSTKPATPPASTAAAEATAPKKDDKKKSEFKAYDEVITDEAVSDSGLVNVHMIDDKLFYEVPFTALGEELLLVSRISKTADNIGYGGEKTNTRRFPRR